MNLHPIQLWRRLCVSRALLPFTAWRVYWKWRLVGKEPWPPPVVKQRVIKNYQRKLQARLFIETGTFTGEMLHAVAGCFEQLISIEVDESYFRIASARLKSHSNVTLLFGDSRSHLAAVLEQVHDPCLFWLDAHSTCERTFNSNPDVPIQEEIQLIVKHPVPGHLVLIDDARLFTAERGYPSVKEVADVFRAGWPGSSVELRDDIIRCGR